MKRYTFIPALERASIGDYVDLFRSSFYDDKLNADYLRWQYIDNPHGRVLGMDAFEGQKLVAHYAIIPRRYELGSVTYRSALSVNTATHPDHQGPQGLFFGLAKATYRAAEEQGIQFIVGSANANSIRGFTKVLQFRPLGQIRLYAGFCAIPVGDDVLDVVRDPEWISWRLRNPSRHYKFVRHGLASRQNLDVVVSLKGVPFHLAVVDKNSAPCLRDVRSSPWAVLGLAPYFGPRIPRLARLPLRFQPSPWHVIWKALDPALPADLPHKLRFDGLSMDTF